MATLFRVGRVRDRGQRAEKVGTRPSSGWSEPGACRDVSARPRDAGRAQPRTARAARGPDTRARRRRRLARQLAPGVTVLLLGTLPRRPRPQFDDPRPRLPSRHRGRYEPEHRTEGREDRSRRSRAGRAGLPPAHSPSCCPGDLVPQAARDAIRPSAADLAPGSGVQQTIESGRSKAVGRPPLREAESTDGDSPRGSGADEQSGDHSPAYTAVPPEPAETAVGRPTSTGRSRRSATDGVEQRPVGQQAIGFERGSRSCTNTPRHRRRHRHGDAVGRRPHRRRPRPGGVAARPDGKEGVGRHWNGIPGAPFGGVNTANILSPVEPSCDGESRRVAHYTSSMARWPPRA